MRTISKWLVSALWLRLCHANSSMTVHVVQVDNQCDKDVFLYGREQGQDVNKKVPAGSTEQFREGGFEPWRHERMIFSFEDKFGGALDPISDEQTTLELNADYEGFVVPKSHMSFITQLGFSDLTIEIAMWKDKIGGTLGCNGTEAPAAFSRAKMTHRTSHCSFADGSGKVIQKSLSDGRTYNVCLPMCPGGGPSDPSCLTSCFSDAGPTAYAAYSAAHSLAWKGSGWVPSPTTSASHYRDGDQWSAVLECWDNQVGPAGFPIGCEMPDELGVWQIVTCPEGAVEDPWRSWLHV